MYSIRLSQIRSVIGIRGAEGPSFIQGLITNDINKIFPIHSDPANKHPTLVSNASDANKADSEKSHSYEDGILSRSIFGSFLNAKGRVTADVIIISPSELSQSTYQYQLSNDASPYLLIDCDAISSPALISQLKLAKLRKKIVIEDVSSIFQPWALVSSQEYLSSLKSPVDAEFLKGINLHKELAENSTSFKGNNINNGSRNLPITIQDPRTNLMGYRVYLPPNQTPKSFFQNTNINEIYNENISLYHRIRMFNGIAEGENETKGIFPLELNHEYLNGVSFSKGCYTGQELVARTHHRGEVRKRLIPVVIGDGESNDDGKQDTFKVDPESNLLPSWGLGHSPQNIKVLPINIEKDNGEEAVKEKDNSSTSEDGDDQSRQREIGKLISTVSIGNKTGSLGLGIFRLNALTPSTVSSLCVKNGIDGNISVIPITPILPSFVELQPEEENKQ